MSVPPQTPSATPSVAPITPASSAATPNTSVLLLDDDELFLSVLSRQLEHRGYAVETASTLGAALDVQRRTRPAAVILDHAMPGTTSVQSVTRLRAADATACLLVLSGEIGVTQTVQAIRAGAEDVLTKPPQMDLLVASLERGLRRTHLLRRESLAVPLARDMYGFLDGSPVAQRLVRQVEQVAMRDLPVLLVGESGTGRRALAEMIHRLSRQSGGAFTSVAMSRRTDSELLEALTAAERDARRARAEPGTWFLNDLGLMSPAVQTALLRLVDAVAETTVTSQQAVLRPRLVISTQRDLHRDSQEKRLSSELLSSLGSVPIAVPSLRERGPTAIALLADRILERWRIDNGTGPSRFSNDARSLLGAMAWPRNIAQLHDVVTQSAFRAGEQDVIEVVDVMTTLRPPTGGARATDDDDWSLQAMERRHIGAVLAMTNGHRSKTAQLLRISRTTLYKKIDELGLDDVPT